jgi:hypothetical protein
MLAGGSGGGGGMEPKYHSEKMLELNEENSPNQLSYNYSVGVSQNVLITASERRRCAINYA